MTTRPRAFALPTALPAALLATVSAGPSTAPSADQVRAALQGSWAAAHITGGKGHAGDTKPAGISLTVDGDQLTLAEDNRPDERVTITLDAAHTPAWFDLKSATGDHIVSGIVDVSADGGQLRMAFRKAGEGDRPTSFDPADKVTVMAFTRAGAASGPASRPAATRP